MTRRFLMSFWSRLNEFKIFFIGVIHLSWPWKAYHFAWLEVWHKNRIYQKRNGFSIQKRLSRFRSGIGKDLVGHKSSDKSRKIILCQPFQGHYQSLRRTGSSGGSSGGMSLGDVRMRRVDSQLINMPDNVAMRHRTESGMVFRLKIYNCNELKPIWNIILSGWY